MRWKGPLATALVLTALAPFSAGAQSMVFVRVDDLSSLESQRFHASYAFETGRRFLTDNTTQPTNLKHRFSVAYGITESLQLSAMQVVKHHYGEEVRPGVFTPQLRLGLGPLLPDSVGAWTQGLSLYFAPRIRITGRRDNGLVFGIGTRTQPVRRADGASTDRRWILTANTGLEVTIPERQDASQAGLRYDVGFGYALWPALLAGFEAWGHATWSEGSFAEQEHAFGPTLSGSVGPVRLGLNGSFWLRQLPNQAVRTDVRGIFVVAMKL